MRGKKIFVTFVFIDVVVLWLLFVANWYDNVVVDFRYVIWYDNFVS